MSNDDVTIAVLREIRDEVRATKEEVRATKEEVRATKDEVRGTNTRLDRVEQRLGGAESELHIVGETLKDQAGQMLMLTRFVKNVGPT